MKYKILLTGLSASALFLSACLKNTDRLGYQGDKGSIVSEIATHNESNPIFVAVNPAPATETVDVLTVATHNAKNLPSGDITIKLELDPALVTAYDPTLVPMPLTSFTFSDPTLEITIPKGTYGEHILKMTVNKSALSLTNTYALGFKIKSVSEGVISDFAHDLIFIFGIKNQWDGAYRAKGYVQHPTAANQGPFNDAGYGCGTFNLVTSGPNSVDLDPSQPFAPGGVLSLFAVYPRFTIDGTGKVTASDASGGGLASVQNFTDYNSRYDAATKTFFIKYGWNGSRIAWDTLTYCGPR